MEGRTKEITTSVGVIVLLILAAIAGAVIVYNFRAYADTLNREEVLNEVNSESSSDASDSSSLNSETDSGTSETVPGCSSCGS